MNNEFFDQDNRQYLTDIPTDYVFAKTKGHPAFIMVSPGLVYYTVIRFFSFEKALHGNCVFGKSKTHFYNMEHDEHGRPYICADHVTEGFWFGDDMEHITKEDFEKAQFALFNPAYIPDLMCLPEMRELMTETVAQRDEMLNAARENVVKIEHFDYSHRKSDGPPPITEAERKEMSEARAAMFAKAEKLRKQREEREAAIVSTPLPTKAKKEKKVVVVAAGAGNGALFTIQS